MREKEGKPVLMMDVDGILYPVAMTLEQYETFEFTCRLLSPIRIVKDHPQGRVINLSAQM